VSTIHYKNICFEISVEYTIISQQLKNTLLFRFFFLIYKKSPSWAWAIVITFVLNQTHSFVMSTLKFTQICIICDNKKLYVYSHSNKLAFLNTMEYNVKILLTFINIWLNFICDTKTTIQKSLHVTILITNHDNINFLKTFKMWQKTKCVKQHVNHNYKWKNKIVSDH